VKSFLCVISIAAVLVSPVAFTACSELPTATSTTDVGRIRKLYADGDCSWSWNCSNYTHNDPWTLETVYTSADPGGPPPQMFHMTWFNTALGRPCTWAGCSQQCWATLGVCTAIFPPIEGGACTTAICGFGGENGGPPDNLPCEYHTTSGGTVQCTKKFTSRDTIIILKALAATFRTTLSDPIAQQECSQMKAWLLAEVRNPSSSFGRGINNNQNNTSFPHAGSTDASGYSHIDPRLLDDALAHPNQSLYLGRLAQTALHEVVHVQNPQLFTHASDDGTIQSVPYQSQYFKWLNRPADRPATASNSAYGNQYSNSCIVF
jgi:hypothetical protein